MNDEYKLTKKDIAVLIIFFTLLIGGPIMCFIFEEYGVLIGFGFCWLLTISYIIRGVREANNYLNRKR